MRQRLVLGDHRLRQLLGVCDVDEEVALGRVLRPAVGRHEHRASGELERLDDVVQGRLEQPRLLALYGEVVDQRDEAAQQALASRHERAEAPGRPGVWNGAAFVWRCHSGALPSSRRSRFARHCRSSGPAVPTM